MVATRKHVVFTSAPTWSHFRPVCVLAAKFAAERSITVTLLVPHYLKTFEKASHEVGRCLSDAESCQGDIRIIAMGDHAQDMSEFVQPNILAFREFWKKTLDSSPITCSATGKEYPGVARPSLVFVDPLQYDVFLQIRDMDSPPSVPIITWMMAFTGGMMVGALPKKYGGRAEVYLPDFTSEEAVDGRSLKCCGEMLHLRGMPGMYDWETYPQDLVNLPIFRQQDVVPYFLHKYARTLNEADGVATAGTVGYDGEALLSTIDEWAADSGKHSFHFGPILPLKPGTGQFTQSTLEAEIAAAPPGVGDRVISFLNETLKSKGERSIIYICFGTLFWPIIPDHLWTLLETLSDRDVPFILSYPSAVADVPESIKERYSDTSRCLLVPWAPQQTILSHKSVGWFVTHGGAGGTMDALTQGVPMIGWPFAGDQPGNIAHLVHTLDVAFEFIEVRTGENGLKPIYKTGKTPKGTIEAFRKELKDVLDNLTSEVGIRKRRNAQKQQTILAKAWAPGGPTRASFETLVKKFGL